MSCVLSLFINQGVRLLTLEYQGCCLRFLPFPQAGMTNVKAVIGGGFSVKEYARKFYSSKAWQRTRAAYAKSRRNLCEVCLDKGLFKPCEIVHHKVELTPENINNPDVTLNWNNLQCLCRECHAEVHELYERKRRYKIDELGRVTIK